MEIGLVVALAACVALPFLAGRGRPAAIAAVVVALLGVAGSRIQGALVHHVAEAADRATHLPWQRTAGGYVSSTACRACHPAQYATWYATYHRTMTQPATSETVKADFDGVRLPGYRLDHRAGGFWVTPEPAAGEPREVVMVTGSHHQQRYWLRGRDRNGLDLFPLAWLVAEQRWVPGEAIFVIPPGMTITNGQDLWNQNCINCHSVAGQPRADHTAAPVATRAAELGIGCEACHGPGADHVRANRDPARRYAKHLATDAPDPTIVNPRRLAPEAAAEVCGQCHGVARYKDMASWRLEGAGFRPGHDLTDDRWLVRWERDPVEAWKRSVMPSGVAYLDQYFWHDGTIRVSGREYNGLLESRCAREGGLTCISCHSMHGGNPDDQLTSRATGDGACSPCHDDVRARAASHTHHRPDSSGSQCYACHMPYTTFGLLTAIRSHRIDSPTAGTTAATGRPNACNLCHLDRTLAWTAEQLRAWYDQPVPALSTEDHEVAASLVWLLRGDAGQRAAAAASMGTAAAVEASGADWMEPYLADLLLDPYAAVRFTAARALRTLGGGDVDYLAPTSARAAARDRILERSHPSARRDGALLLGPDGKIDRGAVDALLSRRDNRPLFLAE